VGSQFKKRWCLYIEYIYIYCGSWGKCYIFLQCWFFFNLEFHDAACLYFPFIVMILFLWLFMTTRKSVVSRDHCLLYRALYRPVNFSFFCG
jgi:hypothetical protein